MSQQRPDTIVVFNKGYSCGEIILGLILISLALGFACFICGLPALFL